MDVSTGKVSPGDPFRAPPAAIWNNMVDAGRAQADSKLDRGAPSATRSRSTDLLKLKNSSGAERAKGEILKISGKVLESITDEHIWLDGVAVTAGCRFGILKEPVLYGGIGTAQVSGVCLAMVNIVDEDHTFAEASGEYVLQSGMSGPLEILYAPDGTGEKECVVRFVTAREPELFIALETFSVNSGGLDECRGTLDSWVGRAGKIKYDSNLTQGGITNKLGYQRVEAEAHCVWMPAESDCDDGTKFTIKCGQYFWGIWNGTSGRYEAIAPVRRAEDATLGTDACPCKWFGYALWKIVVTESVAAWVLDENHCSGCYDSITESRIAFDGGQMDLRFLETNRNDDWVETPTADPEDYTSSDFDENFRYITCCNVTDVPPDDPCEPPACCYVVPVALASCDGIEGESQAILHPTTCNYWGTGTIAYDVWTASDIGPCCEAYTDIPSTLRVRLRSVVMSPTQVTYVYQANWGWQSPPPAAAANGCPIQNSGTIHVVYDLDTTPDCTNDPTATLSAFFYGFGTFIMSECPWCKDQAYWESLFDASINVTRIACDETTTTTTYTTTSTTTAPPTTSTTTASTTTASTTTETSTTTAAPTTTESTTTAAPTTTDSTTTAAPTTTESSTTANPCTGLCNYIGVSDGCGGSPTGFSWSGNGNTCSGCGDPPCETDLCSGVVTAIGRWPADEFDTATLACI